MSRHDRRYLRYLARHQRQGTASTPPPGGEARATPQETAWAANAPLYESLVPAALFEQGIGNLVFSRALPAGRIAMAVFLLDIFCLVVKNAFITTVDSREYPAA